MESKKCVKYSLKVLFLLSVLTSLAGNPLKGKFHPIGPGTDAGLYNEGFFEGDIVTRMDVSINDAMIQGLIYICCARRRGGVLIYRILNYTHERTVQKKRRYIKYKKSVQCTESGNEQLKNTGVCVSLH
jgi:hypothetical protein